jgi:hypothetical protein
MHIANGRLSFLLAASLLAGMSCTSDPGLGRAPVGGEQAVCDGAGLAKSLTLSAADPGAGLTFSPAAGDSLTISGTQTLTGPCIGLALVYGSTGVVMFANDRAVTVHEMPQLSAGRNGEAYFGKYRALDAAGPHPELPGYSFAMATLVQRQFAPGGTPVADHYAGIWHKGDASVVASFSRPIDGAFTTPRPILTSAAPLRSISYFPSPDTPSGNLGLIQEGDRKIHLIAVRWSHPAPVPGV